MLETENFLHHPKTQKLLKSVPLFLNNNEAVHIFIFRKILEMALTQGRWSGRVPMIS